MKAIYRILVIDSDKIAVFILKHHFRIMGYHVEVEHLDLYPQAPEYLMSYTPDLVFVDPLPASDYKIFLDDLYATGIFEKTPVCLLTNIPLAGIDDFTGEYPFYKRFQKPFTRLQLEELATHFTFM